MPKRKRTQQTGEDVAAPVVAGAPAAEPASPSAPAAAAEPASPSAPAAAAEPALIPAWVAVIVLLGLLLLAGAGGWGLHAALNRSVEDQVSELRAIEEWRRKLAETPRDNESRLALADALQVAGQLRSALAEYDKVLSDDPKNIAALYQRGVIYMQLDQPDDAEAAWWAVLQLDEGHVRAAEQLGEYYGRKQQYRSLLVAVEPAVAAHPSEATLQYLMGFAYENLGELGKAQARYQLALDAVPDMPEALEAVQRLNRAQ